MVSDANATRAKYGRTPAKLASNPSSPVLGGANVSHNLLKIAAVSVPGEFILLAVNLPPVPGTTMAQFTSVVDFEKVKHLLSDKPLRHQKQYRPAQTDEADAAEAIQLLATEGGMAIPYEEVRKDLELD